MSSSINNSGNELIAIRQKLDEQEQKLNEQNRELNEMRQALVSLRGNNNGPHHQANGNSFLEAAESSALTDRRGMLKKVAGLAVGVATVGLLQPSKSRAANGKLISKTGAPSTNNDPWLVGTFEDASLTTGLENTSTLVNVLLGIRNFASSDFTPPSTANIAVLGFADAEGGPTNTNDIIGVWGEGRGNSASGVGIGGKFVGDNTGVIIDGGRATFCLFATSETFPPTSPNFHTVGEIIVAQDNSIWWTSNSPLQYRRMGGPGTAGALTLLATPQRWVDTRTNSGFVDAGNHYGADTLRTYNITTLPGGAVPAQAAAIVGRITVIGASGSGVLQESPNAPISGTDLGFGTAVINFPASSTLPAFGVPLLSALDQSVATPGRIRVHSLIGNGTGAGSVDVVIDVYGYYI